MKQQKIIELERQIIELKTRREMLLDKKYIEKFSEVVPEINKLADRIYELQEDLRILKGPLFSNSVIDIYQDEENCYDNQNEYYITISGNPEVIGHIRVTWELFYPTLGNIGYEIGESYRGNHYTLQALELLRDLLIKKGLTKPILTSFPDNIASIKTIEKFGGKLIESASNDCSYNTYEVDLLQDEQIKK